MKQFLHGAWQFSFTHPQTGLKVIDTATVPGNVEPELVRLGLIPDYQPADTEYATTRFEAVDDYTYTYRFDAPPTEENTMRRLVFEGIDTIAEIYLNGQRLGECRNMHLTYTYAVDTLLRETDNELMVVIRSAELWARTHLHDMFAGACGRFGYYESQSYLRKARHQWGWDNAPRLLTSGIFRPVYLETVPLCRFDDVYVFTKEITKERAVLGVSWSYLTPEQYLGDHTLRYSLSFEGKEVFTRTIPIFFVRGTEVFSVALEDIKLWWPAGFGEPNLCNIKLEMLQNDTVVAQWSSPFGVRTLSLLRSEEITADNKGEMVFMINGHKVFARGANWKPLDSLHSRADEKVVRALSEMKALHCNMVRIWGGGIYEGETFFDYCDRNGLMVWQDFMFACEIPPTDDDFCADTAAEAAQIIRKLRNHPSLAVWCGDNENDQFTYYVTRGSQIRPSHEKISREVLKNAVLHHDPYRCYVPSSSYLSDAVFAEWDKPIEKRAVHEPETHLYPPAERFAAALRECRSRFIGETGSMEANPISANPAFFEREKARAERLWDSPLLPPGIQSHQSDAYFVRWRLSGKRLCMARYGRDFSFAEWPEYTLALNAACADIYKDVVEYCRVNRWDKTGVLWWSLLDMWPMMFNYSMIDSEFNRKLPFYWIREAQQPFALMGVRQQVEGELALYATNDTLTAHTVRYTVLAYDEQGAERVAATGVCYQEPNASSVFLRLAERETPELWLIRWEENGKTYYNHCITGKAPYDVNAMRRWVTIVAEAAGYAEDLLELKLFDKA